MGLSLCSLGKELSLCVHWVRVLSLGLLSLGLSLCSLGKELSLCSLGKGLSLFTG